MAAKMILKASSSSYARNNVMDFLFFLCDWTTHIGQLLLTLIATHPSPLSPQPHSQKMLCFWLTRWSNFGWELKNSTQKWYEQLM